MLDIKHKIAATAKKQILFLPHAIRQMNKSDRMVSVQEVKEVIHQIRIIEDYPEDIRGHSVLLAGQTANGRTVHVVCSPKDEYLAVITAYAPSEIDWLDGYTTRRTKN